MDRSTAVLAADLRGELRGEVRFDAGSRALYSTDASNYRRVPTGVVVPVDVEDVRRAIEVCRAHDTPVLPRGGGTSLAGQTANAAVVLDLSKRVRGVQDIDREKAVARVLPGTVLDDLRTQAEDGEPRLTLGPDPATHEWCTVGGMIGNNSCGVHSVLSEFYGPGPRMVHNVEELDVLTYDGDRFRVGRAEEAELDAIVRAGGRKGQIYAALRELRDRYAGPIRERYRDIPRRVSGYNLDELLPENGFSVAGALVGTEGTCVTVLGAVVRLVPSPPVRELVLAGFEDVYRAAHQVPWIRELRPVALEGFDHVLVEDNRKLGMNLEEIERLPEGSGWLMVELGGESREEAEERAHDVMRRLRRRRGFTGMRLYAEPSEQEGIWELRESGLGATAYVPGRSDAWEGWEDSAVPPERLDRYLRDLRELFHRYGYESAMYGHFGHGCVHCRLDFDLRTSDGIARFRRFLDEASDLVLEHGGSLSGEHGDGQSRAELLPKMFGPELVGAFREFKRIWDPEGRMNPGKVADPDLITSNLRLGTDYRPPTVRTHFAYSEDGGDFAHAAMRCVGVGKCRRTESGTMCPSYMVTREEQHTTRGRARALFEMMRGELDLWKSDEVHDTLELCLSCKACKAECPVNVDMATYKAEFLSHYYQGRLRPPAAYAMGLIPLWARLGSVVPGLANAAASAPGISTALKRMAGVAPQRQIPKLARRTFRRWFDRRGQRNPAAPAVVLWPDTFTNHFEPHIGAAAVEVLEAAGCRVVIPPVPLCCGRPLYDFGMVDTAKRWLGRIVRTLRPAIRAGASMVGIEPSCVAVFRDELPNLFPHDADAQRLAKQTLTLSEFLDRIGWEPPRTWARVLVQTHCHHKAVMGFEAEERILDRLGVNAEVLDSGCCGMAGSFGFEAGEKYRVSVAAGERVLLPAVREAPDETLVLADGFSCRTQIEQGTGRRALHVAEVLRDAVRRAPPG